MHRLSSYQSKKIRNAEKESEIMNEGSSDLEKVLSECLSSEQFLIILALACSYRGFKMMLDILNFSRKGLKSDETTDSDS